MAIATAASTSARDDSGKGAKAIGSLIDYTPRYPGTVFANAIWNYGPTIEAVVADVAAGNPVGRDYTEYSFMKYGGNELIYVAADVPADAVPEGKASATTDVVQSARGTDEFVEVGEGA